MNETMNVQSLEDSDSRSIVPDLEGNASLVKSSAWKVLIEPGNNLPEDASGNSGLNQNSELINLLIKAHETRVEFWRLGGHANFLHMWHMLFNKAFFNSLLPTPVISFREQRKRILGSYKPKRNEIGVLDNININPRHFHDEPWEVLCTLLHEEMHQLQEKYGKPGKSSRHNYHNRQFQFVAEALGIPCDRKGQIKGHVKDPFVSLLERHGIKVNQDSEDTEGGQPGESMVQEGSNKLKKFSCGCEPPINVRVADRRFSARCNLCGENFQPAPPSWRR